MTGDDVDRVMSVEDRELLDWLARVAETVDPEPQHLRELGKAALSVRRVDAELAQLVADSALLAGAVRSGAVDTAPRLLTFLLGDLAVDVQVTLAADGLELIGVLDGLAARDGGWVEVESPGVATTRCELDPVGRFAGRQIAPGLVRLRVRARNLDVTTDWVTVGR